MERLKAANSPPTPQRPAASQSRANPGPEAAPRAAHRSSASTASAEVPKPHPRPAAVPTPAAKSAPSGGGPSPNASPRQFDPEQEAEAQKIKKCKSHYDVLGVDKNADESAVKKAYRKVRARGDDQEKFAGRYDGAVLPCVFAAGVEVPSRQVQRAVCRRRLQKCGALQSELMLMCGGCH